MILHPQDSAQETVYPIDKHGDRTCEWANIDLYHQKFQQGHATRDLSALWVAERQDVPHLVRACKEHGVDVVSGAS